MANELIKEHEQGKCSCNSTGEEYSDNRCLAYRYLYGNIDYQDFLEEVAEMIDN